jgi:anthranilate synthase component 1
VQGGERFGRYSIIGLASPTRIVVNAHQVLVLNGNRIAEREDDTNPLDFIGKYMKRFRAAPTTGCRASAAAWSVASATTPSATSKPA